MKNLFAAAVGMESNMTYTENGAKVYSSTGAALLDLFANIGSLRSRSEQEIIEKFEAAYNENPLLAMKMAFYVRNVRGGLGERRTFKIIIRWLAEFHTQDLVRNIKLIPHYGRWDGLYELMGTDAEPYAWATIAYQFLEDIKNYHRGEPISLLAKWLKSENASSKETRALGRMTAKKLGLSAKQYRQTLSKLRAHIDVVEAKMSAQNWDEINFSGVPSRAMSIYRNAFEEQAPVSFQAYKDALLEGSTKINASTLYPYDILEKANLDWDWNSRHDRHFRINEDAILEAQWKALPNYVEEPASFMIMADTSGSMTGRPMATSIGLAIYFAERNLGEFHNKFMTFSGTPNFVTLKGESLKEKVACVPSIVSSTDLEAGFELILDLAITYNVPQGDMPKALVVISDGEIDQFTMRPSAWDFLDNMKKIYALANYTLPKIVMWNVESRADRFIDNINNPNVQFISGSSPSAFKSLIRGQNFTAEELMLSVLNDPMYDLITI